MYHKITIKKDRERFIYLKHPWVFRESISENETKELKNGEAVYLMDSTGGIVATGSYSDKSIISVRIFEFAEIKFDQNWWTEKIRGIKEYKELLGFGLGTSTNGYRLVYAESDGIPGLIVDVYGSHFVIQSTTRFIDDNLSQIEVALRELFDVESIFNKSELDVRKIEGLDLVSELVYGNLPQIVQFKENGIDFASDIKEGQKTGFFLDQKDLRKFILDNPKYFTSKHILNLFSYSGATGIYAMKAGAKSVHNIDLSERALDVAAINAELNSISLKSFTTEKADMFDWIENTEEKFDVIFLDPPALIKGNKFKQRGEKAYHYLNRHALRILNNNGILITSSCSHFLSSGEFGNIIRQGANQLGIRVRVLHTTEQSTDHTNSIYFPEGRYLKSFVLQKY
jgi:23S rRNA (cytosine1962-C5)-methyltransferase